ncbi:FCD domain-containing protein [Ancylobacter sp. A5.8]|uniref:FCD domain-containing protein n=1 Tax=Ancylobacter gelatini TaxID=2919920 RepID=UPI001F4D366B|nr:FCD domain-containing protein [Ancylobacter gelatini]MCJ8142891.1 FCD domain-containing protein [Ancylobacter gelatini]
MSTPAIELLKSRSLPMLIEEEIQRVILSGEYEPGDRINEKELTLRFGTSRGPIREALRSLEASGLIEQIPNRGVFVRRLTGEMAAHIYDVRAFLFALAGRLLALRATDDEIATLRGFVRAMDAAIAADDFDHYVRENFALHEFIVAHAANPVLAAQYLSLIKQLRLYRTRSLMLGDSMQESNREHHEMVEAIAAHDADRAQAAHMAHVMRAKHRLISNTELT